MGDNQIKLAAEEANIGKRQLQVLCVDDEVFNLEIMEKHLHKANYRTVCATDAYKAWDILKFSKEKIDAILLDRMMPGKDGLELLRDIKSDRTLKDIPVILQTAKGSNEDAIDGIEAGAYYYVTKPYAAKMLLSVLEAAIREFREHAILQSQLQKRDSVMSMMKTASYEVKTPADARELAAYISVMTVEPAKYIMGLTALMINAVEHGNLGIGAETKYNLLLNGAWEEEVNKRLALPENQEKAAVVSLRKVHSRLHVSIRDSGPGFRWQGYLNFDPTRMADPCGKGIAIANMSNPGHMKYNEAGNEVTYTMPVAGISPEELDAFKQAGLPSLP